MFGDEIILFEDLVSIFYTIGDFYIYWDGFLVGICGGFYFIICELPGFMLFIWLLCIFGIIVFSANEKSGTIPPLRYSAW
jgi:hypothetical protein